MFCYKLLLTVMSIEFHKGLNRKCRARSYRIQIRSSLKTTAFRFRLIRLPPGPTTVLPKCVALTSFDETIPPISARVNQTWHLTVFKLLMTGNWSSRSFSTINIGRPHALSSTTKKIKNLPEWRSIFRSAAERSVSEACSELLKCIKARYRGLP